MMIGASKEVLAEFDKHSKQLDRDVSVIERLVAARTENRGKVDRVFVRQTEMPPNG